MSKVCPNSKRNGKNIKKRRKLWEEVWTEERRERKVREKCIFGVFFVPVVIRNEKVREYIKDKEETG